MFLFYLLKQIYVYFDVHFYESCSSFPCLISIDIDSDDQNPIETKFIVLVWDQHELIILLCKTSD